ncbi:hypothetical protein HPB52_005038 [Rhipicephalus sanguineus]|uniref:PX domain-containing protein n=1 Tax=Rhipicephalus sanguineus TaxID=34632 RepID=A0A9D4PKT4_RHISA|nr:hypothetical protein HPB52_005038 [Rhipicephalus sanguineus]
MFKATPNFVLVSQGIRLRLDECRTSSSTLVFTHTGLRDSIALQQFKQCYNVRVQRGFHQETTWVVQRRYSDFDALHSQLQTSGQELPLPPKKLFNKMSREFIAERQQKLQEYLDQVLSEPLLSQCLAVKRFLDPNSYSQNFCEAALQHVSMLFRSEDHWEVVDPLPDIGWRFRKQYFMVRHKGDLKDKPRLLMWVPLGPDFYLTVKDLQVALKLLTAIQASRRKCLTLEQKALLIKVERGDRQKSDIAKELTNKEAVLDGFEKRNQSGRTGAEDLPPTLKITSLTMTGLKTAGQEVEGDLKPFGLADTDEDEEPHEVPNMVQMWEDLHVLQDKVESMGGDNGLTKCLVKLEQGHLHLGNIVLRGDNCVVTALQNQLLGLPSRLRPLIVHLKKVRVCIQ